MNTHDWIQAELMLWLMRLTGVVPQRQPGTTYAIIQEEVSRLAALPIGFELPDIRGMRQCVKLAHARWAGKSPRIPAIPPYACPNHHRREEATGRLLAAGIAAADIDHAQPVLSILTAIKTSLIAHDCVELPIEDIDPCGFLYAGATWGRDFGVGHPKLIRL